MPRCVAARRQTHDDRQRSSPALPDPVHGRTLPLVKIVSRIIVVGALTFWHKLGTVWYELQHSVVA